MSLNPPCSDAPMRPQARVTGPLASTCLQTIRNGTRRHFEDVVAALGTVCTQENGRHGTTRARYGATDGVRG